MKSLSLFAFLWAISVAAASTAYPSIPGVDPGDCSLAGDDSILVPPRREVYDDGRIFDISHRYVPEMPVWESKEGLGHFLWLAKSMKNGSRANNSVMKLGAHTGTHVDAPSHFYDNYFDAGFDVDTLDLRVLNGLALLVDVPRDKNITAEVMKSLNIPRGVSRVLFRTLNTERRLMFKKEFDTSYVGFKEDGAKWLVENTDIKLVGIDYLSAAAYDHSVPSHLVFLESRCGFGTLYGDEFHSVFSARVMVVSIYMSSASFDVSFVGNIYLLDCFYTYTCMFDSALSPLSPHVDWKLADGAFKFTAPRAAV